MHQLEAMVGVVNTGQTAALSHWEECWRGLGQMPPLPTQPHYGKFPLLT